MATSPDVETLERETAEARVRLANTLDRLTSPATAQAVKQELSDYAQGLKDQAIDYVQKTKDNVLSSGRGKAEGYMDGLKQKAFANPLGLALIGAGIGWHFYKKPPITTLLIGAGVAALMKGSGGSPRVDQRAYRDPYDPVQPRGYVPGGVAGYGYPVGEEAPSASLADKAETMANVAVLRTEVMAHDLGARAREMASETTERVSEAVDSARSAVTHAAEAARSTIGNAAETVRTTVLGAAETARTTVTDAVTSARTTASETMAGTKAVASDMAARTTSTLTHTADEAKRRASGLARQAQTSPLLLGALGVAVGTALVYSLRSTEAGERMTTTTRRAAERGGRRVGSGYDTTVRRTARSASDMASSTSEGLGDMASRARDAASDIASSAAETASGVASAASRAVGAARETVSSSASGAYEAAASAARNAADLAASAGRRLPETTDRVQRQLYDLGERYPLLLGAVSLAIGAAVGGSLRLSESENRLMGPISDRLKQRARQVADEQLGVAREAAEHFADELGTQFRSAGQPQDTSADFETVIGGGKPAAAPGDRQGVRT